jgi:hypothetical protein
VEGDFDAVLGGGGDAGVELQGHLTGAQLEAETAQDVRQHQLGLDDRKSLSNAVCARALYLYGEMSDRVM